jgi:predicted glycosyltransferase
MQSRTAQPIEAVPHALRRRARIWIDLDNTPHVPFFKPIIRELRDRGHKVALSARDAFQVCDMADQAGLDYRKIGRHYGRSRFLKVWGLAWRSLQLLPFVLQKRPTIALSHGSRSQILICNLLGIPTVMLMDYEFAQTPPMVRPRWEIVPDVLQNHALQCKEKSRIRCYRGIKEDVYACDLRRDATLLRQLGIDSRQIIATVRPPACEAHYHHPDSDLLFECFMERLCKAQGVVAVLLPRNKSQEAGFRKRWPHWFTDGKVIIPKEAVDGLNLLWHSDLVVSGGGTMNREAAALDVPVYSIFRGKMGAIDRHLHRKGRMALIESVEEIYTRILFQHRDKSHSPDTRRRPALDDILDRIEEIITVEASQRR